MAIAATFSISALGQADDVELTDPSGGDDADGTARDFDRTSDVVSSFGSGSSRGAVGDDDGAFAE